MKDINGFILYITKINRERFQFVINWEDIPTDKYQFSFIDNLCREINRKFPNLKATYDVFSHLRDLSTANVEKKIKYQLD